MEQLPPYAARSNSPPIQKPTEKSQFDYLISRGGTKGTNLNEKIVVEVKSTNLSPSDVNLTPVPLPFQKRKLCMLSSNITVSQLGSVSSIPMQLSISDSGMALQRDSNERKSIALSTGIEIDIQSEDEDDLKGHLFLSVKKLRQLCDVTQNEGNLFLELGLSLF